MNTAEELREAFADMGKSLGESLRTQHIKELYSKRVDYKRGILLTLCQRYKTPEDAVEAGYPLDAIKNAVSVLRKHGYIVDLSKPLIMKAQPKNCYHCRCVAGTQGLGQVLSEVHWQHLSTLFICCKDIFLQPQKERRSVDVKDLFTFTCIGYSRIV